MKQFKGEKDGPEKISKMKTIKIIEQVKELIIIKLAVQAELFTERGTVKDHRLSEFKVI